MIVRKQRELVIRMGEYESHRVVGEITLDTNNEDDRGLISGYNDDPTRATADFLDAPSKRSWPPTSRTRT
jgi:hypothetical protein